MESLEVPKINRENKFGEKWLTDVTEMKYGAGKKAYLSAILDLADKDNGPMSSF